MAKFQRNGVENGFTIRFATYTVMEKVSANEDEDYIIVISSEKRFNKPIFKPQYSNSAADHWYHH